MSSYYYIIQEVCIKQGALHSTLEVALSLKRAADLIERKQNMIHEQLCFFRFNNQNQNPRHKCQVAAETIVSAAAVASAVQMR